MCIHVCVCLQVVSAVCKNEKPVPTLKQEGTTVGKRASHPDLDASDLVSLCMYLLPGYSTVVDQCT